MAKISLDGVSKHYGRHTAVPSLDLTVRDKEFVVLIGPSGCGKSTTLRMIAGLEEISGGTLSFDGRRVNDASPVDRNVAMVFQNYALYPHMTVERNLSFGLENLKLPAAEIAERVGEAAKTLALTPLLKRRPSQLSGGQRQRVAMGRAIVRHPSVFLFDEPLSNLDAKLRAEMRIVIKRLHRKVDTTVIYVTHDQIEAMTLADRIVVMRDGRIEQEGAPQDLFDRPANLFVAGFLGSPQANLIQGQVVKGLFRSEGGRLTLALPPRFACLDGHRIVLGLRPDDVTPANQAPPDWIRHDGGIVEVAEPLGVESYLSIDLAGQPLVVHVGGRARYAVGSQLPLAFNGAALLAFDPDSEVRIELEAKA